MWTFGMHCSLKDNAIDQIKSMVAKVQQGMAGISSLDFDHLLSYCARNKVTYELVTHEYNKLEVGEWVSFIAVRMSLES